MPGASVGAGGATTDGVNLLPSVGLIPFSVGVAGVVLVAGDVVVDVGVVVEVGGAGFSLLLHEETNDAIAMSAAPPATAAIRVPKEGECMKFLFG
ncbi:hypothetical protein ACTXG7_18440 [Mycolicibacterium sp. Dal123E01]|uniref:hypothetical protein n=1 Tax=Mycolicibacterium sp. Dal123E01 TaxID=3457578 RepID=UPI00403EEA56